MEMKDEPLLSIVIVSYNTCDMLKACLQSLPRAVSPCSCEVWVVDNHSQDGTVEMLRTCFPEVQRIENQDNPGFAKANNQALRLCRGEYLLLLNPDTEPEPGSLALMVNFLQNNASVGAAGPKLLNTDGSLQRNGARFPSPLRETLHYCGVLSLLPAGWQARLAYGREDFDAECEVDQVSGACLMIPRRIMEECGALDEDFFMFFEEVEWCLRIRRAGSRVMYLPQARVVHHWMGSVRKSYRVMERQLNRSRMLYYRKTAGPLRRAAAWCAVGAASLRAAVIGTGVWGKRILRRLKGKIS